MAEIAGALQGRSRMRDYFEVKRNPNLIEIPEGATNGEVVKAFSRRGEIAIPARITNDIREGIVNIPMHFVECAANVLTNSDSFDPKSKMVELKACAIQVEKLPDVVEMKGEVYKEGTDTEIKAENMATTTVKVGK